MIRQYAGQVELGLPRLETTEVREPGFRFQLNFDANFNSHETSLLKLNLAGVGHSSPGLAQAT